MSKFTDIFSSIISSILITSSDTEESKAKKIIWYAFFGSIIIIVVVSWMIFVFATFGDNTVKVPNIMGDNIYSALSKVADKNLVAEVSAKYSNEHPEGTVYWQKPSASDVVKRGRVVTFYVSLGPSSNSLPDFRGLTLFELSDFFDSHFQTKLPFEIATVRYENSESVEKGRIISQNPTEGTPIKTIKKLELVLSNGIDSLDSTEPELEDYTNKDLSEVVADMAKFGLLYSIKFNVGNYLKNNGKVSKQSIAPGMLLRQIAEENKVIIFEIYQNETINNNQIEGFYDFDLPKKPIPYQVIVKIMDKAETSSSILLDIKTRGGVLLSVPYYNSSNNKLFIEIEGQEPKSISL